MLICQLVLQSLFSLMTIFSLLERKLPRFQGILIQSTTLALLLLKSFHYVSNYYFIPQFCTFNTLNFLLMHGYPHNFLFMYRRFASGLARNALWSAVLQEILYSYLNITYIICASSNNIYEVKKYKPELYLIFQNFDGSNVIINSRSILNSRLYLIFSKNLDILWIQRLLQNLIQFPKPKSLKGFNAVNKYFYVVVIQRSDEAHVTT